MFEILGYTMIGIFGLSAMVFTILTVKFLHDKKIEEKEWESFIVKKIDNIGTVEDLTILPLADYYAKEDAFITETGVSYLIKADDKKILFDVGFNVKNEHPSPLLRNMEKLKIDIEDINAIFISHLHPDHVGGLKAKGNRTFALSREQIDLKGLRAYVPVEMTHSSANIQVVEEPIKIAEGIVNIGRISRAIWGMGLVYEQGIAINVRNKGLVLIVGCGHQTTEKVLERANALVDIPVYGIIGGLHFPVTKRNDKIFNARRILGTGKLPWRNVDEKDVEYTIRNIIKQNIEVIGISPHDSCDWTLEAFRKAFGEKYREILVGEEIKISDRRDVLVEIL
ncbi:MAG: MBL fold metallo-hydrolase [Bacillota bacterium]